MADMTPAAPPHKPKRVHWWMVAPIALLLVVAVSVASHAAFSWGHRPASLAPISREQQDAAVASARAALGPQLAALGNLSAKAGREGIVVNTTAGSKTAIPVFFAGENASLIALVDSASGQVVQTVEIRSSGYMAEFKGQMRGFPHGGPRPWPIP